MDSPVGKGLIGTLEIAGGVATGVAGASTLHKCAGVITTESLTTAAGSVYTHTLSCQCIKATDVVLASVSTPGAGTPVIAKISPGNFQVTFTIQNVHASAALNNVITISYVCFKQS